MRCFAFAVTALLILSCNNATHEHAPDNNAAVPKTLSDSLYKAVMDGHNTAMAKMGEIIRYRNLIKQQQDSIAKLRAKDPVQFSKLDSVAHDLDYAKELMNKWMDEFEPDKAGNTEEEKNTFYTKEKEKVDTIQVRIENSIKRAKEATSL